MMTMRIPTMVKTSSLFGFAFALVEKIGWRNWSRRSAQPSVRMAKPALLGARAEQRRLEADRRLNLALLAHVYPDRRLGSER